MMLAPLQILDQLKLRVVEQLGTLPLRADGASTGMVSLLLALPRAPAGAPQLAGPQFQFLHPQRQELRAGYGCAAQWDAEGSDRLERLGSIAEALRPHWHRSDPDETGLDAFAMLGFAAGAELSPQVEDHLPNAILWIPQVGLCVRDGEAALVLSATLPTTPETLAAQWVAALEQLVPELYRPQTGPLMPAALERDFAEPDFDAWSALIDRALLRIRAGELEKVVLSRRVDVDGPRDFDIGRLLGALSCLFPSCQIINIRRNGKSFVAATPERLLTRNGPTLEVDAVAGTAARAETAERDAELARALAVSDKNLREHRFVIDAVREALADCCEDIVVASEPRLMQLSNAQHLWSPIRAVPRAGINLFQLADRLHPTPATNGHPRERSREWLRRAEPFVRGWYTGAAGFVEPDLTGELWVLLRCARVCGTRAELYAGAGIVDGSDAATEWDETEAKLKAMLTALQYA